jgi:DsbC/DsbD-like thiol-disulfide interchange protein
LDNEGIMRQNPLIIFALAALPSFGFGQSFDDLAHVDVLTGWRSDASKHMAAIKITLAPGWITYWRAPGDAGIPPEFSFLGSDTIQNITPHWPTPEVFGEDGARSIGYYDNVIVPLTVDLGSDPQNIAIQGEVLIGVCEEICIPVTLPFSAILPVNGARDAAINAALGDQPMTQTAAKVGAVTCNIDPIADGLRMTTTIDVAATGTSEHVVIEASDPRVWVSEARTQRDGNMLSATVDMVHPSGQPFAFDRSAVRITVLGSDQAIDIRGCSAG